MAILLNLVKSSCGADRYQQRNRLPLIDPRLRYAQIANKHFALFSEGVCGWNTRPHRQCINCYKGRRVRRSGASPRVDANPPPTSEMGAVFAHVSSLNASCGDNRQSPPRRRHHRRGRDHCKNVLPPLTSWPMRPTTSPLRGSGAEPASWITRRWNWQCRWMLRTIKPSDVAAP